MCPLQGTWTATQACALTGKRTRDPLVHRLALNPLSHTSQGIKVYLIEEIISSYRATQKAICCRQHTVRGPLAIPLCWNFCAEWKPLGRFSPAMYWYYKAVYCTVDSWTTHLNCVGSCTRGFFPISTYSTVNVFSLPYDFLNSIFFPLAYCKNIAHVTYKVRVNQLFM